MYLYLYINGFIWHHLVLIHLLSNLGISPLQWKNFTQIHQFQIAYVPHPSCSKYPRTARIWWVDPEVFQWKHLRLTNGKSQVPNQRKEIFWCEEGIGPNFPLWDEFSKFFLKNIMFLGSVVWALMSQSARK